MIYLVFGLVLMAPVMWGFARWSDYSDQLLMIHYGYDFDAADDAERFQNVSE